MELAKIELRPYWVFHEKGGFQHVLARNPQDALEQYYEGIKSVIGHQLKICDCFGDKPLDREKVLRPLKIKDSDGQTWKVNQDTYEVTEENFE